MTVKRWLTVYDDRKTGSIEEDRLYVAALDVAVEVTLDLEVERKADHVAHECYIVDGRAGRVRVWHVVVGLHHVDRLNAGHFRESKESVELCEQKTTVMHCRKSITTDFQLWIYLNDPHLSDNQNYAR